MGFFTRKYNTSGVTFAPKCHGGPSTSLTASKNQDGARNRHRRVLSQSYCVIWVMPLFFTRPCSNSQAQGVPGLELKNEFSVNMPIEEAWPMLLDVARIVQCVPGGELLEKLDARNFKGRVSVKLGPMLLTFEGNAKFIDIDEISRQVGIEARGTDKKGRGAAQAKVRLRLEPKGQSTNVLILTDMRLSGSVAQIGRASGLIEDVSRQIVESFANNLNQRFGAGTFGKPLPEHSAIAEPSPGNSHTNLRLHFGGAGSLQCDRQPVRRI